MHIDINKNKVSVDFQRSTYFSKSRNTEVQSQEVVYFEFFRVDSCGNLASLEVDGCVSEESISKFKLLLCMDYVPLEDLGIVHEDVASVARETYARLNKEPFERPFKTEWPSVMGDPLIFFGGGVDSRAVAGLYPEARKIVIDHTLFDSYGLCEGDIFVKSNLKSKGFTPRGFVFWSQPFAIAPILTDCLNVQNPTYLLGSILGSSYLMNGKVYFDRESRSNTTFGISGNTYHSLYNELDVNLYAPFANCSEYISTQIELLTSLSPENVPAFCQNNGGTPCFRCFKCLRKTTERYIVAKELGMSVPFADISTVRRVAQGINPSQVNFKYFYHIWNKAVLSDPLLEDLFVKLGFTPSKTNEINLDVVYSSLERYYQGSEFSDDKLSRLESYGIAQASQADELALKNYNPA